MSKPNIAESSEIQRLKEQAKENIQALKDLQEKAKGTNEILDRLIEKKKNCS